MGILSRELLRLHPVDIVLVVVLFPVIVTALAMLYPFYIGGIIYQKYRSSCDQ